MSNLLLFFFLFLGHSEVISGVISDPDGNPIPSVLVKSGDQYAVSNSKGQFTIALDSQGTLLFQAMGFGIQEFNINEMNEKVEFILYPIVFELPEIEILALNPRDIVERARGKLFFMCIREFARSQMTFGVTGFVR
jgi:hypothetical protein